MKFAQILTILVLLISWLGCSYNADCDDHGSNVRTMNTQEVIDYIRTEKTGKSFFAAEWCGGCSLTYKNIVLHNLSEYDYEVFFWFKRRIDSLQKGFNECNLVE